MRKMQTLPATIALGALVVGGVTACATTAAPEPTGGVAAGLSVTVIGGPLSDPFFGAVQKGGQDAAAQLGADYEYLAPTDFSNAAADLSRLLQTAIDKKPDILVVGNFIPPVEEDLIAKASQSGITVVVFNSGSATWQKLGAIGFVGEDPTASGTAAGELQAANGVTSGLCVNHVPDNPVLQLRCDGYIAALETAGGTGTTLTIPSAESGDQQSVSQKVGGYLKSNPDVNGVFTLGASVAVAAESAIADTGRDVTLGTTDISQKVLTQVKDGTILFAIDQQGYLQTYYATLAGLQDKLYGLHPISAIITSPLVITSNNVDTVIEANSTYGVRGAQ